MPISGRLMIGFERLATAEQFRSRDPARDVLLVQGHAVATAYHVDRACRLAAEAFDTFRRLDLEVRARFLERCADNLMQLGDELLDVAGEETGLPKTRLVGERLRTANQLRLFGDVVRRGDWLGLRVDRAEPDRKPMPRADLRQRRIPLGPVAIFGASNFPLAFSAAGGDVASALAAGCPVIVKAHPSHPGTSELAATAVFAAALQSGLPNGVYSHLSGPSHDLGGALVRHPAIQAVAFTGSRRAGLSLTGLAASREVPIPVFAEMSSINPVVLMPGALETRANSIAAGFMASLTLGVGQFCTNPGLVLCLDGSPVDDFVAILKDAVGKSAPATMLSPAIANAYYEGVERLQAHASVSMIGKGHPGKSVEAGAALFAVPASTFLADASLREELFGPSALLVRCKNLRQLKQVLESLDGQLTATLQMEPSDYPTAELLIPVLEKRVGRIVVNGWPTGVEVSDAMVHGGPFPATSDSRTTSVGTLAMQRFLRPVCYQDFPPSLLPEELHDEAARSHPVLINGTFQERM